MQQPLSVFNIADLLLSQLRQKRYSDTTQEKLDETRVYWDKTNSRFPGRYCRRWGLDPNQQWQWISGLEETVRFLYGFFSWRCDLRRGKKGRHCPGIRYRSSLESFWKWWHLVLKQETAAGLSKEVQVKVQDLIAIVAEQKGLELTRRPKKNMYNEDVAEFARSPLGLHYRDIALTLIRDPEGGRPRLFIFLKPEFTKKFLGKKAPNEFKIPEIIFDPTLVLSPHVCLLGMLFHINGFKSITTTGPVLDSPEKLYSLGVLDGLGQQELKLKDELFDKYAFCQTVREAAGFRIAVEKKLLASTVTFRMRRAGQITERKLSTAVVQEVTDALQNVMLQHADIRTFIRHYEVDVDVDVQGIVRKTGSQTPLVRFACSLSASIDPDRPFWLSAEESKSLNQLPAVRERQRTVNERKRNGKIERRSWVALPETVKARLVLNVGALTDHHRQLQEKLEHLQDRTLEAKRKYNTSVRELRNEKQRQRNQRIRENLERYKNEQPLIDLERQLAGKLVDTKVMGSLERKGFMPPQQMLMIDAILTLPGTTLEAEYQRRIHAINAVTAFCGVEEGRPTSRTTQSQRRPVPDDDEPGRIAKRHQSSAEDESEIALRQAMEFVRINSPKQRPQICFLCLGNPDLSLKDRLLKHSTPGSLTRHFLRKHVNPSWPAKGVTCTVCEGKPLQQRSELLNHAEVFHGTVVGGTTRLRLAREVNPHLRW
ncbi:uncharacterized protein BDW70DRAFT_150295 [Aspergillus foveolatus]|uniref:uncharacterized protein n=1 Tax=Aspergillus foveolatus TaxID=210207 RepID=UPI003CCD9036